MGALDQHGTWAQVQNGVSGGAHVRFGLDAALRDGSSLGRIRRNECGARDESTAQGEQRRVVEQGGSALGDHDGVDDERNAGRAPFEDAHDHFDDVRRMKHASLYRVRTDVAQYEIHLQADEIRIDGQDPEDPKGVLGSQRRDGRGRVATERRDGFDVGLNPSATSRIGASYYENSSLHQQGLVSFGPMRNGCRMVPERMISTRTLQSLDSEAERKAALLGAIEGGGTKFICAVGRSSERIVDACRIETSTPEETMQQVVAFFSRHPIEALGVGMFGPLELRAGASFGSLLATPKPGWAGYQFYKYLDKRFDIPIAIDTDVNAAALGEALCGAARGCGVVLYVTVGTGVGGGVLVDGQPLHGMMHAEFGHIPMPVLLDAAGRPDVFGGSCPYHGRCLEGLIAGPALLRRTGKKGESLDPNDVAFDWAARYLGVALASAVLTLSPQRIIVGGGVMASARLLPKVQQSLMQSLAGYVVRLEVTREGIDDYVVPPALGTHSGITGAFALAERALTLKVR